MIRAPFHELLLQRTGLRAPRSESPVCPLCCRSGVLELCSCSERRLPLAAPQQETSLDLLSRLILQRRLTRTERCKVLHQHLEYETALDGRGQHALAVFHDEGRRAQAVENADVFTEQVVPLVLLGHIAGLPF